MYLNRNLIEKSNGEIDIQHELVSKDSLFALELYQSEKREDAPPIAWQIDPNNSLLFVADGMGGASSGVIYDDANTARTEAYMASHKLSSFVKKYLKEQPTTFINPKNAEDFATTLEEKVIGKLFPWLEKKYGSQRSSMLKGTMNTKFGTTISCAKISKGEELTSVTMAWQGDSPIFVVTEDQIYSTHRDDFGDASIGKNALSVVNHALQRTSIILPRDRSFAVVLATDWIAKQGAGQDQIIQILKSGILGNGSYENNFVKAYKSSISNGGERDDATLSAYICGKLRKMPNRITFMITNQGLS